MSLRRGIVSIVAAFLFTCLSFATTAVNAAEGDAASSLIRSNAAMASELVRGTTPKKSCVDACYTYGEGATCACDLSFCSGCDWCQGDVGPGPDWPFAGSVTIEAKSADKQ